MDRLRSLLLALDRRDRLETAHEFVGWLEIERTGNHLPADAREMLLRALKTAADPVNFEILRALDSIEPVEISALMERLGLARVAVSERLNDMVQAGLAVREMVNDQVRGTDLSAGIVVLVESISAAAGRRLGAELGNRHRAGKAAP